MEYNNILLEREELVVNVILNRPEKLKLLGLKKFSVQQ
jgi:hypothetical protein